ncbi:SMP-30/gluconolactonase/LRE family protein [Flavimaricola marinus]|uniref:L-arabinolactonase n=1 Tax=Flavimaricola marinus TaxID=1819565 RepID=A0A238LAW6_9RHOB|nr:SMP-30/gluconolactonase/LRE family protein [Flavimaricola marinus]SMY06712.1 L-arabinolactonase [Flavimaricola marinus]
MIYDDTVCLLGEGPLWHPERGELFWFDILARRLHRKGQHWQFDDHVSAAGWVDAGTLLVASSKALLRFDITTGATSEVCPLEADNDGTRSNDGRADPWGGFWIGTMGKTGAPGAGTIYRYYKGELRTLYTEIKTPNAICFAPDRSVAYYTDTGTQLIKAQPLDPETGWPVGEPSVHIDLTGTSHKPDGAVTDAAGNIWCAQWGSARVACYGTDGGFVEAVSLPAAQTTCPAFGGPDFKTLLCTSAAAGISQNDLSETPTNGQTFAVQVSATGKPEPRVIL